MLTTVGYFTETPEQQTLMTQFEQTSNPVSVFCDDRDFNGTISRDDIYRWYTSWCEETGHRPLSRERFLPKFRDYMGDRIRDERRIRNGGTFTRVFDF